MTNFLKNIFVKFRHLILYGIIGLFTSSLDFAVFSLLVNFTSIYYIAANCISVLVGISTSFLLNRTFNFQVKDKTWRRFLIFLSVGLCGLCISNLILKVGIGTLHSDPTITKLASIAFVVIFQFLLNKYITFRTR